MFVMAGLDPAIPVILALSCSKTRDARHKAGHDGARVVQSNFPYVFA
jgi:hypothetical protein